MSRKAVVIGAGFSGLAAATTLASHHYDVTVIEKNATPGGRARKFVADGFTFDMGPSWYWMPDVIESYFNRFGSQVSDFYTLKRLDPSYKIFFGKDDSISLPGSIDGMVDLFESLETGSGIKLRKFLSEAEYKYTVGMTEFVYNPSYTILNYLSPKLALSGLRMHLFTSFYSYIRRFFKNPRILQMLEFPILFLGGTARSTPAMYSLMNYGDIALGTWYPMGGMYKIIEGMVNLAASKGVKFEYNQPIEGFDIANGKITAARTADSSFSAGVIVGSADYHHIEQTLLPEAFRQYSPAYWDSRVLSPSALIYYIGINKKLKNLEHHNLFFDQDFEPHADTIYKNPSWPENPSFYVCCVTATDTSQAPDGHENLFVLVPVAPGIEDTIEIREHYYSLLMDRMEHITGEHIKEHVVFKQSYAHRDFERDYHAYKGNAYGLANTLRQTAFLKPSLRSRKLSNLFYTGQLTVPGPGVPPALISGQVAGDEIARILGGGMK